MNAEDAWEAARRLQGTTLLKWTGGRQEGQPFKFKIREVGQGPAIGFIRNGREVKSASFDRFRGFFDQW